jgi:tRNA A37 threonylcarbamoyladenosine dehydratase
MDHVLKNMRHRTEMVLGPRALELLAASRVIIFGVGGVGSWCAESLIRSGLMDLTIVDSDIICATNINRQLQATAANVGRVKVTELAGRLADINPQARVTAIQRSFDADTWESFGLGDFDYVIDAIDSLANKILLIDRVQAAAAARPEAGGPGGQHGPAAASSQAGLAKHGGPVLFSSMGAAAKLDPTRIRVDALEKTRVCPLARHVRRRLHERGLDTAFLCVYSDESPILPRAESICGSQECSCTDDRAEFNRSGGAAAPDWCARKKRINGSLVHITAIFGFMLSGLVVQDTVRRAGGGGR